MEEILASIRRIISDEEEETGGSDADKATAGDEPEPIELTQEIREDGSVVDLSAAKAQAEEENGTADPDPTTVSETMADEKEAQERSDDTGEDVELVESEAETEDDETSEPPPAESEEAAADLLSDDTVSASMASMSEVVAAAKSTTRAPAIGDGRTLEDLAREMIAPELKNWLDQNLAPLVERVVREEIKKMVRRVEDQ